MPKAATRVAPMTASAKPSRRRGSRKTLRRSSAGGALATTLGVRSGGGPASTSNSWTRSSRARSVGSSTAPTSSSKSGGRVTPEPPGYLRVDRSLQTAARGEPQRPKRDTASGVSQHVLKPAREPGEPRPRARLDRPQRDAEELGDLGLRALAPVRKLENHALAVGKVGERGMHAPGDPARLGALGGGVDVRFFPLAFH